MRSFSIWHALYFLSISMFINMFLEYPFIHSCFVTQDGG